MFSPTLTMNCMQPTMYIDYTNNSENKKNMRHRYLKYVEHWIDKSFASCKDRAKVKVLQDNVIRFVDTFRFYNLPIGEDLNTVQFCMHNVVYKNGESSVSTYMQLTHLGSILKFETTFFLNNPDEVMLNVTKEITSANIANVDILSDPSKMVKISSNHISDNYQQVMHNLEDFHVAELALQYLKNKDGEISGEDIKQAYRNKFGAYVSVYIDPQKVKDFIKVDKIGRIVGFNFDDLMDGKTNVAELMSENNDVEAKNELMSGFNLSVNPDIDYEIVVDNNHMIPIEEIYTIIPQFYIDNLLCETYDVFAFLTQNNCADNEILHKAAQLITKYHNHKVEFIEYLRNNEGVQAMSKYIPEKTTNEEDEVATNIVNGVIHPNDENRDICASILLKTVSPNFDDIIGYNQVQAIYSIDTNIINELVTSRLACTSTLICDELIDFIKVMKREITDKYHEIRKNYGIHCNVNNMYYLYSAYLVPIHGLTTNTYQNLKAFDDMNYIFSDDEDDDDD